MRSIKSELRTFQKSMHSNVPAVRICFIGLDRKVKSTPFRCVSTHSIVKKQRASSLQRAALWAIQIKAPSKIQTHYLAASRLSSVCVYVCVFIATIKPSKWKCNANTSSPVVLWKFPARAVVAYIRRLTRAAREAKPITKCDSIKTRFENGFQCSSRLIN
jgi:hypothetical protein